MERFIGKRFLTGFPIELGMTVVLKDLLAMQAWITKVLMKQLALGLWSPREDFCFEAIYV